MFSVKFSIKYRLVVSYLAIIFFFFSFWKSYPVVPTFESNALVRMVGL